jgi:hypothetical protein
MKMIFLAAMLLSAGGNPGSVTVSLKCQIGMEASALGVYGGQSVGLSCKNGKVGKQVIVPVGSVYSFRVGTTLPEGAYDCAYSGDALPVSHDCAGALLTVQ